MRQWTLGPVLRGSTYRRWAYLVFGGAMLVPPLVFAAVAVPAAVPVVTGLGTAFAIGTALTLAATVAVSAVPAVRVLEGTAVRVLLDDPAPEADAAEPAVRLRMSALFVAHALVGGLVSAASLVLPVVFVLAWTAPFTGEFGLGPGGMVPVPAGWAGAWLPAAASAALLALVCVVAGTGALFGRAAAVLLGVPAGERIARLERRAERLVERDLLARELHDSVGHALSVVSVQAGAARRVLDRDRDGAEAALLAIEDSARAALEDLDHVLGLLRDEAPHEEAGLARLPALLAATEHAGIEVDAELRGDLGAVGAEPSAAAFRIVQESLTNVLRHAGKVPVVLRVEVADGSLRVRVRNPRGESRSRAVARGGRGLVGIAERVELLRGEFAAGPSGDEWEVAVRIPLEGA
ncbi:sensor histidine kinase [Saccharopolyspora gregorii]|uniref:sensor histidine kinase n=1 Tax=Saccharopolyspora gregorii TaxID=33914 RepID=UPI0021ABAAED|nr:histidine kinase [Saccharopolyspora gregorii]